MFKTLDVLQYWCYKILPLVYDDSLSYYEVLCKVKEKLNEVIENTNLIPDLIKSEVEKIDFEKVVGRVMAKTMFINVKNPPEGLVALKGDGGTDDTPAFQAIVDYVNAGHYGCIYFPAGRYVINSCVLSGTGNQSAEDKVFCLKGCCKNLTKIETLNGFKKEVGIIEDQVFLNISDISILSRENAVPSNSFFDKISHMEIRNAKISKTNGNVILSDCPDVKIYHSNLECENILSTENLTNSNELGIYINNCVINASSGLVYGDNKRKIIVDHTFFEQPLNLNPNYASKILFNYCIMEQIVPGTNQQYNLIKCLINNKTISTIEDNTKDELITEGGSIKTKYDNVAPDLANTTSSIDLQALSTSIGGFSDFDIHGTANFTIRADATLEETYNEKTENGYNKEETLTGAKNITALDHSLIIGNSIQESGDEKTVTIVETSKETANKIEKEGTTEYKVTAPTLTESGTTKSASFTNITEKATQKVKLEGSTAELNVQNPVIVTRPIDNFNTYFDKQTWNNGTRNYDVLVANANTASLTAGGGGTSYSLPTMSQNVKGGAMVGQNLSMNGDVLNAVDTKYSNATGSSAGLMSAADKNKLDGITQYSLPTMSTSIKGGAKVGDNLFMRGETLNVQIPTMSTSTLGGAKIGSNLTITNGDTLNAINTTYNVVSPDGTANGLMSVVDKKIFDHIGKTIFVHTDEKHHNKPGVGRSRACTVKLKDNQGFIDDFLFNGNINKVVLLVIASNTILIPNHAQIRQAGVGIELGYYDDTNNYINDSADQPMGDKGSGGTYDFVNQQLVGNVNSTPCTVSCSAIIVLTDKTKDYAVTSYIIDKDNSVQFRGWIAIVRLK